MRSLRVLLLLVLCMVSVAALAQESQVPVIVVTGSGTADVEPDLANITVGVITNAKTAKDAQSETSAKAQRIVEAILRLGIDRKDVQTTALNLQPIYDNDPQTNRPRGVTYMAQNSIRVRVLDLAKVGPVVDAAVAAGANNVESISFGLRSDKAARQTALKAAVEEARGKAEAMAAALGLRLTDVHEVVEGGGWGGPVPMYRMEAMQSANAPVMPGQVTVQANVTVKYRFVKA